MCDVARVFLFLFFLGLFGEKSDGTKVAQLAFMPPHCVDLMSCKLCQVYQTTDGSITNWCINQSDCGRVSHLSPPFSLSFSTQLAGNIFHNRLRARLTRIIEGNKALLMHMLVWVRGVSVSVRVCVSRVMCNAYEALLWCGIKTGAPNENLSSETWHANKRHDWTRELPQLEAGLGLGTNERAVRLSDALRSWVDQGQRGEDQAGQSRIKFYDILRRTKVEQVHRRRAH